MKMLLITFMLLNSSCSGKNKHGECIGIIDKGDPKLAYELSGWNLGWSLIGFEMILPPVLWATDYAKCPVARKASDE